MRQNHIALNGPSSRTTGCRPRRLGSLAVVIAVTCALASQLCANGTIVATFTAGSATSAEATLVLGQPFAGSSGNGTLQVGVLVVGGGGSPLDLDGDGSIGIGDLLMVLADWGPCDGCIADVDGDGMVGVSDLIAVLAAWS